MTFSFMSSVSPVVTATVFPPELRVTSAQRSGVSRWPEVQLSFCKSERAGDKLCGLRWSHSTLNDRFNSKESTRADYGGRYSRPPSASYGEAEAVVTSTNGSGKTLEDVKKAVIRSVANTNRGKNTSYEQRQEILKLLKELESLNPTFDPVNSPLSSGRWALLYTAPLDANLDGVGFKKNNDLDPEKHLVMVSVLYSITEKTADKYAGTEEGPFLSRIKPAAFGSVKQTSSVQVIDSATGLDENIAYFIVFGLKGNLTIKGSIEPAPPKPEGAVRVNVIFESFVLTIGSWKSPTISLSWIKPKGWVDTTFLDSDMRIGRGDKGSIFLSSRMKQDET